MGSQIVPHFPHTDVRTKIAKNIPRSIFFVFTTYASYPDKVYHKKFDDFETAKKYVQLYQSTIDGVMVIKEYVDAESFVVVQEDEVVVKAKKIEALTKKPKKKPKKKTKRKRAAKRYT